MNHNLKRVSLNKLLLIFTVFVFQVEVLAVPPRLIFVPVDKALSENVVTDYLDGIEEALKEGELKHVVFDLSLEKASNKQLLRFADYIFNLRSNGIVTIAYIQIGADPGLSTFLAATCQEIALSPGAEMGGLEKLNLDSGSKKKFVSWAKEFRRPYILFERMTELGGEYSAYLKTILGGDSKYCFLTPEQYKKSSSDDKDALSGMEPEKLCDKGSSLLLKTGDAKKFGIAQFVVQGREDLLIHLGLVGLKEDQIKEIGKKSFSFNGESTGFKISEFLQKPFMRFLLIMGGLVALFLEFQMPGLGIPGLTSLLCFGAFFASGLVTGYVTYFELGLFLLSLILILLEIMVIPGFGVAGISGAVALLVSLVLAMYKEPPGSTHYDWEMLSSSFFTTVLSLSCAIGTIALLTKLLPKTPLAKRGGLVNLTTLSKTAMKDNYNNTVYDGNEGGSGEAGAEAVSRHVAGNWPVGVEGISETCLRPAGKARLEGKLLDVVSGTDYIEAGTPIVVIRREGPKTIVIRKEEEP